MAKYQTWHVWTEVQNEEDLTIPTFWRLYTVEAPDRFEAASQAAVLVAAVPGWTPLRAHAYDMGFTSTKSEPLKIVPKRVFEVERPTTIDKNQAWKA